MLAELFNVTPEWSANFLLVLTRLTAAVVAAPMFGARGVPVQARVGLALLVSLIVLPLQGPTLRPAPAHLLEFAALAGSEALVGFVFGMAVGMVFHALEMAATLIGVQMGFGLGQIIDPLTGGQTGTIEQFYRVLVALVFFAMNGHHLVIQGLVHSFEVAPPGTADLSLIAGERVIPFFISLFVVAIRIALPVTGALMLTDVALGLVGRTVPQMNVLVVGFPVKIGVGLLVMVASLPFVIAFMAGVFGSALVEVNGFLVP